MSTTISEQAQASAQESQGACRVPYRALHEALRTTALGTGKQMPVLGQVLVEVHPQGRVNLTTYNYDAAITVTVAGETVTPGRMLVPHATMTKVLAAAVKGSRKAVLDEAVVDLEVVEGEVVIRAQGYGVPLEAAGDLENFPQVPSASAPTHILERAEFVDTLSRVFVAANREDAVPVLCGARMTGTAEELTFTATDRYRLARGSVAAQGTTEVAATLPEAIVRPLLARLDGEQVGIGVSDGPGRQLVTITAGPVTAVITALDGDYPSVERILEQAQSTSVTVDRAALLEAATRAAAITTAAAGKQTPVMLTATPDGITIAPGTEAQSTATAPVLPAQTTGEAVTVGANPPFLVEAVKSVTGEQITVQMGPATAPMMFTAAQDGPVEFRHMLMPVRLA